MIFLAKEFEPYLAARRSVNMKFYSNFCWLAENWMIRREREQGNGAMSLPYNMPFTPILAIATPTEAKSTKVVVTIKFK